MYLSEEPEYIEETAMLIEEVLRQRIAGMKNAAGYTTVQTFPKLLYVLEPLNLPKKEGDPERKEDGKYYYLSKLAAESVAKTMNPDFISQKVMKNKYAEYNDQGEIIHDGVFPCMGCVSGDEVVTYRYNNKIFTEGIERMYNRISSKQLLHKGGYFKVTDGVEIFDSKSGKFVKCLSINKNRDKNNWKLIKFNNGRQLLATEDHPLPIIGKGRLLVKDIHEGDQVYISDSPTYEVKSSLDNEYSWVLGVLIRDSSISSGKIFSSFAMNGEDDIISRYIKACKNYLGIDNRIVERFRGIKGDYKDVIASTIPGNNTVSSVSRELITLFEGELKKDRHIPQIIFESDESSRLSFLAGMIDADGYINSKRGTKVQIGSTNKELSVQTFYLFKSLGYNPKIYINHYSSKNSSICWRIECKLEENDKLMNYITCSKKLNHFNLHKSYKSNSPISAKVCEIINVPTDGNKYSFDVTTETDFFDVSGIISHNCRSFLSKWVDPETGKPKYYGRYNKGVQSINLPDVALSSGGDMDTFWKVLDERLELIRRVGEGRYESLKKNSFRLDGSPIHWKHGGISRFKDGESFESTLTGGYSTISLGFIGVYEMCMAMLGKSNTTPEGHEFAVSVVKHLKEKAAEWNKELDLGWSLYSTPSEGYCETSWKKTKKRFGEVLGVTDHGFFTNSYHVYVGEEIDIFSKLEFESEFQDLCSGGCISYGEIGNLVGNQEVILEIMDFIYDNIQYAELNTQCDRCNSCGSTAPLLQDENDEFFCPECGSKNVEAVRRICGYLGVASNGINKSKRHEMKERVKHI